MTKTEIQSDFDPNAAATEDSGIFGLPFNRSQSQLVLIPVPWDVTTSYGDGTHKGPQAILRASHQVDLFDLEFGRAYENGIFLEKIPEPLKKKGRALRKKAELKRTLASSPVSKKVSQRTSTLLQEINRGCEEMVHWVYEQSLKVLREKKWVGVVGGDHSTPLGCIRAVAEHYKGNFGVLHIDAHADLRESYEGFKYSHASIMRNVVEHSHRPQRLVQVGIRDFCEEEFSYIQFHRDLIHTFFDSELKHRLATGESWHRLCDAICDSLPENVFISFDIDGLDPSLCPNTGTPVAGGLSFSDVVELFSTLIRKKKKIIGFDLNEVAPGLGADEWDGNVGARILYKLCGNLFLSNGLASAPERVKRTETHG